MCFVKLPPGWRAITHNMRVCGQPPPQCAAEPSEAAPPAVGKTSTAPLDTLLVASRVHFWYFAATSLGTALRGPTAAQGYYQKGDSYGILQ